MQGRYIYAVSRQAWWYWATNVAVLFSIGLVCTAENLDKHQQGAFSVVDINDTLYLAPRLGNDVDGVSIGWSANG